MKKRNLFCSIAIWLILIPSFLIAHRVTAVAQANREQVTPEPVVVGPASPVAVVVDMRDGFWMQAYRTIDLDGRERQFTLIYFPKRYLTGPETWTIGTREALVQFVGCEAFTDCTPELSIRRYRFAPDVPVLMTRFGGYLHVFIFPLVTSPTSHKPVGIALID